MKGRGALKRLALETMAEGSPNLAPAVGVSAGVARTMSPSSVDSRLLERVRQGDVRAFEVIYDRLQPVVLGMALRRGCPSGEAEDVTHEVFVSLWRSPPDLETAQLTTWLYRVTANKVASHFRGRAVRHAFAAPARLLKADADPGHHGALEAKNAVQEVLARMKPKKREILVLFELEGRTGTEVAELLGCSENTVWTRLHHARREFEAIARRLGIIERKAAR